LACAVDGHEEAPEKSPFVQGLKAYEMADDVLRKLLDVFERNALEIFIDRIVMGCGFVGSPGQAVEVLDEARVL